MKARALLLALVCLIPLGVLLGQTPPPPTNLTADTVQGNVPSIGLAWEGPSGIWQYKVYRSVDDTTHFGSITQTFIKFYFDLNVSRDHTYYYHVTTVGTGGVESQPSNRVRVSFVSGPPPPNTGTITGLVTDDSTSAPIPLVQIQFYKRGDPSGSWIQVVTNSNGVYQTQLDTGTYVLRALPPIFPSNNYVAEWYNNVQDSVNATPVHVQGGATFTANFGLGRGPAPPPINGVITGLVKDDSTDAPIPFVQIQFYKRGSPPGTWIQAVTGTNGRYHATLDTGTYILRAIPPFSPTGGYIGEWYDNVRDSANATAVHVQNGATFTANFGLTRISPTPGREGTIAGTVKDDSTNLPIPHLMIRFFKVGSHALFTPFVFTDQLGRYSAALDTGTYLVKAEPLNASPAAQGYRPEWYDNSPDAAHATPVHVLPAATFTANFGLSRNPLPATAIISGTVRDLSGHALGGARVVIMRTIQEMNQLAATTGQTPGVGDESMMIEGIGLCRGVLWTGLTDSLGHYSATVLSGKSYIAMASKSGFLIQFYNHESNPLHADIIVVNGNVANIDFDLIPRPTLQNSISGIVRDSAGTGVPSRVLLLPVNFSGVPTSLRFGHTDSTGAYTINAVPTGKYFVLAVPFSGYAPAFYKAGAYGIFNWREADTVNIAGAITQINIGVVHIRSVGVASINGRVSALNGASLDAVNVYAKNEFGEIVGYGLTDASGDYSIEAAPTGTISISTDRENYNNGQTSTTILPSTFSVYNVNVTMPPIQPTSGGGEGLPSGYRLMQNYPNPFNPSTTIVVDLPIASVVQLGVYNMLGQEVATLSNGWMQAGSSVIVWNGKDNNGHQVVSGVFIYRMTATGSDGRHFTGSHKMILLK